MIFLSPFFFFFLLLEISLSLARLELEAALPWQNCWAMRAGLAGSHSPALEAVKVDCWLNGLGIRSRGQFVGVRGSAGLVMRGSAA